MTRSRLIVFHTDAFSRGRRMEEIPMFGICLEHLGIPDNSIALCDLDRAPQIGDLAVLEDPTPHPITGLYHLCKKLGIARKRYADGRVEDVVTLQWVGPAYEMTVEKVLGTVVAVFVPGDRRDSQFRDALDRDTDSIVAEANRRFPGRNFVRKPAAF